MFCSKCGNQIDEEGKFCPYCGFERKSQPKMIHPQASSQTSLFQHQNPMSIIPKNYDWKRIGFFAGITAAILLAIIIVVILLKNRKVTITLDKYISFECDGYDGYGTAKAVFDTGQFITDYNDKIKLTSNGKKYVKTVYGSNAEGIIDNTLPAEYIACYIKGTLTKEADLSNGDTITYLWDISEKEILKYYNVNLVYNDISYTINDLKELGSFNAFDGIEVEYSGTAPNGKATIKKGRFDGVYSNLTYSCDKPFDLRNGDQVKVSVTYGFNNNQAESEYLIAKEYGELPETWEKTFTVEGLQFWVEKINDIPKESLDAMKNQMQDYYDIRVENDSTKINSLDYIGSYLLFPKDTNDPFKKNSLILVYKVESTNDMIGDLSYYTCIGFSDLKIIDGICNVDLTTYDIYEEHIECDGQLITYGYKNIDEVFSICVTSKLENYTYDSTVEDSYTNTPTDSEE